ncbi:MAG: hypothetical protein COT26_01290 [Candidatus Kerfeldbacteria bacterium CG08_land_8_20_14_0_20_43_14]|uniref:Uncharacterized protein n=1 Tax=Candidatus Kerfeldbacteria bacterium CG08_land_8_20_14_0_20_43_14 TaxID=2014246 RepID=A0A2H0YQX3_9BACT|nr:MAG: hypothetical protein COT26_01290 [Candidatus Kerfeldbacteria bacterium CG08_land_8_20_14_0_20_43_14]
MNKQIHKKITEQIRALITGALGLVAALAWNEAVKALFEKIFGTASGLIAKFLYAIIVTAVVVWVVNKLSKLAAQEEEESNSK